MIIIEKTTIIKPTTIALKNLGIFFLENHRIKGKNNTEMKREKTNGINIKDSSFIR
jgi:hypothetical protein